MTNGTPCVCDNACLFCCGISSKRSPSFCHCHKDNGLCFGCSTAIRLYNPIMDSVIASRKNLHRFPVIVSDNSFIELEWLAEISDECILTDLYDSAKRKGNMKNRTRNHKHHRMQENAYLPQKPQLQDMSVEIIPTVYDTIFYLETGTQILADPWWLPPIKVCHIAEGGNPIHIACEKCNTCNAIFDTNEGALCFSCNEQCDIEFTCCYEREIRNYNNKLRKLFTPKVKKTHNGVKSKKSRHNRTEHYDVEVDFFKVETQPRKTVSMSVSKQEQQVRISKEMMSYVYDFKIDLFPLRESVSICFSRKNTEVKVSKQSTPPYWNEYESFAKKLFAKQMGFNKLSYQAAFPELPSRECCICNYNGLYGYIETPCKHLFCRDCLTQWATTTGFSQVVVDDYGYEHVVHIPLNNNCPICRTPFSECFIKTLH